MKDLYNILIVGITLSLLLTLASCGEDEGPERSSEELLQEYFAANGINPEKTASGLYYVIEVPGNDTMPTRSSTVTVHYQGYFLSGEIFDSSYDRGMPSDFSLRGVIPAWTEGIPLFGIGGKGSLYVPSELGYGERGSSTGTIPPNTPIAFDIELLGVK